MSESLLYERKKTTDNRGLNKIKMYSGFYYYMFFRLCKISKKINKGDQDFAFTSTILISLLMGLNLFVCVMLIKLTKLNGLNLMIFPVFIMVPVFIVNYFLLINKGKSVEIIASFEKKNRNQLWDIFLLVYVIVSIAACIILAQMLRGNK